MAVFADDMFVNVEKCKIDQTLSELISDYRKFSGHIGLTYKVYYFAV